MTCVWGGARDCEGGPPARIDDELHTEYLMVGERAEKRLCPIVGVALRSRNDLRRVVPARVVIPNQVSGGLPAYGLKRITRRKCRRRSNVDKDVSIEGSIARGIDIQLEAR